ncbi:Cache 3/Cache 2 fusion domain-containing protein, partial [Ferrovibrio sp.]|uniref:methyl-accepting chemotaxis protein n=1 Tax=Ferrovibrio sp. TaxID=1917215 RepID=UPI00311E9ED5
MALNRLGLVAKITLISVTLILLTAVAVGGAAILEIRADVAAAVIQRQNASLRTAAVLLRKAYPDTQFAVDGSGRVTRLSMKEIPEFTGHEMIDEIGLVTGETATVFRWEADKQDFIRKTTNIKKDDGSRAVGTPLGKASAAYAPVVAGRTFLGEAKILGKDYYTVYQPILDPGGKAIGILYAGALKSSIDVLADRITLGVLIAAIVAAVLSAVIAFWLLRRMLRPLPQLTEATRQLAADNLAVEIDFRERSDEIGALARAVEVFKTQALEKKTMEQRQEEDRRRFAAEREAQEARFQQVIGEVVVAAAEGDLGRRVDTNGLGGVLQNIGGSVNTLLGRTEEVLGAVTGITSALAAGDLRRKIEAQYGGRFGALVSDINTMTDRLRDFAGRLNGSAAAVRDASGEISAGSQDLAQRTESQAASIEETAASMHEITTTVKQNADNA